MRKLLVSLHDVNPVMEEYSKRMADVIMETAGPCFTMLVVPDYHSRGRLDRFPGFCSWLREMQGLGVEIAQHGFRHLDSSKRKSLSGKLLTHGEGEFSTVTAEEARKRIEQGYEILSEVLGAEPSGFTAPAWLYSRGTLEALKGFSFRWTEFRTCIDYGEGRKQRSPVIVFASRTKWKRLCSIVWSAVAPGVFAFSPVVRAGFHVKDFPVLEKPVRMSLRNAALSRKLFQCGETTRLQ